MVNNKFDKLISYKGIPSRPNEPELVISPPTQGTLKEHIDNINRLLRDEFGEGYEVTGCNDANEHYVEISTNLPFMKYLEHAFKDTPEILDNYDQDLHYKYPPELSFENEEEAEAYYDTFDNWTYEDGPMDGTPTYYGFIDTTGRFVIEPEFEDAQLFNEGGCVGES